MREEDAQTLTPREAFAFATTWRAQLSGCVQLVPEESPASLFSTTEWITFHLSGELSKSHYARATTIVWFALSCCKGFSGRENPQFWQRILSRWSETNLAFKDPDPVPDVPRAGIGEQSLRASILAREYEPPGRRLESPPQRGVRFFPDEDEAPFPRVQLSFGRQRGTDRFRTFLGLLASPVEKVDAQMLTILTQLAPFIRETQWQRRVPVAIHALHDSQIASVLTEWQATESVHAADSFTTFSTHKFQVKTISGGSIQSSDLVSLDAKLPLCGVEVTRTPMLEQIVVDGQLFRGLLRRLPRRPQRNTSSSQPPQWRLSRVEFTMGSSQNISALCSALPHIPSVLSLDIRSNVHEMTESMPSSSSDWAWLGYAVFHPDAARDSALTTNSIQMNGVSVEDLDAFESMARGSNLSPEGENQALTSEQYVEGYIESSTSVWMLPGDHSGSMPLSSLSKTWVTVCVSSIEVAVKEEWLCVVNPGSGFGYICGSDILGWRSRPPGQPSLRSLRIEQIPRDSSSSVNRQIHDEQVVRLLRLVGENLTALDWQGSQHISVSTMLDLRKCCPHLKNLRVGHDGAVWADPSDTTSWPELEEMEFDFANTTEFQSQREVRALQAACLPKLKALKFNVGTSSFATSKDTMHQILKDHKELQFLWWSSKHEPTSWISDPEISAKCEFENQLRELKLDVVRPPMQLARRLAFLSVVGRSGNFDPDLSALVFTFEPRVVPREIYIDL